MKPKRFSKLPGVTQQVSSRGEIEPRLVRYRVHAMILLLPALMQPKSQSRVTESRVWEGGRGGCARQTRSYSFKG